MRCRTSGDVGVTGSRPLVGKTLAACCLAAAAALAGGTSAAGAAESARGEDALRPKGHFSLERPGDLSKSDALTIYNTIADGMARDFAVSGEPSAKAYRTWRRYNDAPYRSKTHGKRYVNNYANAIARDAGYGRMKPGDRMPPGAILVKDSFTFTSDRALFAGALFIMEKLPPGASPATGDWRYAMVMPDGSLFGDTRDDPKKRMAFCHDCHDSQAHADFLYFLPEDYRRRFLGE